MRFKRPYLTHEAAEALKIHKNTLYKWADYGWVRMVRDGVQQIRVFDGDEIDRLAPHLKRGRDRGKPVFPEELKKKH